MPLEVGKVKPWLSEARDGKGSGVVVIIATADVGNFCERNSISRFL